MYRESHCLFVLNHHINYCSWILPCWNNEPYASFLSVIPVLFNIFFVWIHLVTAAAILLSLNHSIISLSSWIFYCRSWKWFILSFLVAQYSLSTIWGTWANQPWSDLLKCFFFLLSNNIFTTTKWQGTSTFGWNSLTYLHLNGLLYQGLLLKWTIITKQNTWNRLNGKPAIVHHSSSTLESAFKWIVSFLYFELYEHDHTRIWMRQRKWKIKITKPRIKINKIKVEKELPIMHCLKDR